MALRIKELIICSHGIDRVLLKYSGPSTRRINPRWRHQMEAFSALLALCAGNSRVTGEFPTQRPVTRSFVVFFDLRPNKRLSKQWWFETPSRPLLRHYNGLSSQMGSNFVIVGPVDGLTPNNVIPLVGTALAAKFGMIFARFLWLMFLTIKPSPWETTVSFASCRLVGCAHIFLAATKQLYEWYFLSVCLSVCPSVCLSVRHTVLTMFPSSYHHEIFRSYHQGPG